MRDSTIARNYAETLIALADKAGDREGWGELVQDIADAIESDIKLRRFLESPRISEQEKSSVLAKAFGDKVPPLFLRFLQILVTKRRQMLVPAIASEYHDILDQSESRVHANVTVAQQPGDGEEARIAEQLSRVLGKKVVTHVNVNPAILGGVIVKVGDTVMDGSLRRRLHRLRWQITRRVAG
ncbi:MAG: F0F1 ATP synthase subunit delta [Gemmatimonadota bacterium]|nr:F0F1 ATP synthase subunit delta [Gemmatimonadota bacterium]